MGNEVSTNDSTQQRIENNLIITLDTIVSPSPRREGHCAIANGNKIYIFSGGSSSESGPTLETSCWSFDTESKSWNKFNEFPSARTGSSYCLVGHKLYIFGGLSSEEGWLSDVHIFDAKTGSWSMNVKTSGTAPAPRDKHSCCVNGNKIYVFGGFGPQNVEEDDDEEDEPAEAEQVKAEEDMEEDEPATFGWFNDIHVLDTDSNTWSKVEVSGTIPSPRAAFGGLCVFGNSFYIFGGRDSSQRTNDLYAFDTTTNTWSQPISSGTRPAARSFHSATVVGNYMVIFGGLARDNKHFNDIHLFDTTKSMWLQPKEVKGSVRERGFHSATLINDKLYIFGGSVDFDSTVQECKTILNDMIICDMAPVLAGIEIIPPTVTATTTTVQTVQ